MDLKYKLSAGLLRGGGGSDPLVVKDYEKNQFFLTPSLNTKISGNSNNPESEESVANIILY